MTEDELLERWTTARPMYEAWAKPTATKAKWPLTSNEQIWERLLKTTELGMMARVTFTCRVVFDSSRKEKH